MVRPTSTIVIGLTFIILLGASFGVYYQDTLGVVSNQNQSISSLRSQVSSLQNKPPATTTTTLTITSTTAETTTFIGTVTKSFTTSLTTTATTTIITATTVPWNASLYLSIPQGCPSPGGKAECWSENYSLAIVFTCAAAAAAPQGCTQMVNGSGPMHPAYVITIWYPYATQPSSLNCAYSVPVDAVDHNLAYCISLNKASFILSFPRSTVPP